MTLSATSRLAYATSNFEPKERLILDTLKRVGALTRKSIATLTGLPINCVAGRVNHLIAIGAIEVDGTIIDPDTHKPNELVRAVRRRRAA